MINADVSLFLDLDVYNIKQNLYIDYAFSCKIKEYNELSANKQNNRYNSTSEGFNYLYAIYK